MLKVIISLSYLGGALRAHQDKYIKQNIEIMERPCDFNGVRGLLLSIDEGYLPA